MKANALIDQMEKLLAKDDFAGLKKLIERIISNVPSVARPTGQISASLT